MFGSTLSVMREFDNSFELKPYTRALCQNTLPILAFLAAAVALGLIVNKVWQRTPTNPDEKKSFESRRSTYLVTAEVGKSCKEQNTDPFAPGRFNSRRSK